MLFYASVAVSASIAQAIGSPSVEENLAYVIANDQEQAAQLLAERSLPIAFGELTEVNASWVGDELARMGLDETGVLVMSLYSRVNPTPLARVGTDGSVEVVALHAGNELRAATEDEVERSIAANARAYQIERVSAVLAKKGLLQDIFDKSVATEIVDLLAPQQTDSLDGLRAEVARLGDIEAKHKKLKKKYAKLKTKRDLLRLQQAWSPLTKYFLVKLDEDMYIPWSNPADAPAVTTCLTRKQSLSYGFSEKSLKDADQRDTEEKISLNRAGPGEVGLTLEGMRRAYANHEAYLSFRLTPDLVRPASTWDQNEKTGEWGTVWSPWAPEDTPEELPKGMADRFSGR